MDTTAIENTEGASPVMETPKIRMDKSRPHSTVHGERGPGDPHAGIHFYQDGLPHDAQGFLILDGPDYEGDSPQAKKNRDVAARKVSKFMAKSNKARAAAMADGGPEMPRGIDQVDEDDDEELEDEGEPVNLSAWVRGEQQVEWNEVTQEIARRYKKRVASIADAVPFLVKEGICPANEVAKKFKKFLD